MITTLIAIVNTLTDTGVNDYPANFKITDKAHVFVYYVDDENPEVELVQVSEFTAGSPNEYKVNAITESGFNIELRDTYDAADDRKISIRRTVPFTQEVEYPPGNDFPGSTHERALDKLTAIIQQFNETIARQIGMPLSEDAESMTLPNFISNYYLGLNGDNELIWKIGTVAVGNNEIKDSHIDWGTASEQVSAVDMPIADTGDIITATEVEGALQENRVASDLNTIHKNSDGKTHSDVVLNNTHRTTHDGSFRGKAQVTISNYDNDSAPQVKDGSIFDNNGVLIKVTSDTTPAGYSGISNSASFYLYWDEDPGAFIYSETVPTWSDALQGWYNSNDRAFFSMFKDSGGTLYQLKTVLKSKGKTFSSGNTVFTPMSSIEKDTSSTTYVTIFEYIIPRPGIVKTSFDIKTSNISYTAYGRVYINDVAIGTQRTTMSASFVTFTEDLSVSKGDRIQLKTHISDVSRFVSTRNFFISCNKSDYMETVIPITYIL